MCDCLTQLTGFLAAALVLLMAIASTPTYAAPQPQQNKADDAYLNIPDEKMVFNDRSALADPANLQSKVYSEFIHKLYRFDSDNLQKFDHLAHQEQV